MFLAIKIGGVKIMAYPDFIICPKCKSKWDTRIGHAPDCFQEGICPKCGWLLKKEYKVK